MDRDDSPVKILMVMERRACNYCGKSFRAQEGATKEYCSDTCKNRARYPPNEYQKNCEFCGAQFRTSGAGARERKFCSDKCRYAEERRRERGEDREGSPAGPHAQGLFDLLSSQNVAWSAWGFPVETDAADILVTVKDIGRYLDTLSSEEFSSRFNLKLNYDEANRENKIKEKLVPWAEVAAIHGYGKKNSSSLLKNQSVLEKRGPFDRRGILEEEE